MGTVDAVCLEVYIKVKKQMLQNILLSVRNLLQKICNCETWIKTLKVQIQRVNVTKTNVQRLCQLKWIFVVSWLVVVLLDAHIGHNGHID